jgi:hypothetical protein
LYLDTQEREAIRLTKETIFQRIHRAEIQTLCHGDLNPTYVQTTIRESTLILLIYKGSTGNTNKVLQGFLLSHKTTDGGYFLDVICAAPGFGSPLLSTFLMLVERGGATYVTLNALSTVLSYYPRFGFEFRKSCDLDKPANTTMPAEVSDWIRASKPNVDTLKAHPPFRAFLDDVRRLGYAVDTDNDCDDLTIPMNDFMERRCNASGFEMRRCFKHVPPPRYLTRSQTYGLGSDQ